MRATIMPSAHEVRIDNVPDAAIVEPTDAIIRVTRACICGSDLWPFNDGPNVAGQRMGHEAIGVVQDVGSDVHTIPPPASTATSSATASSTERRPRRYASPSRTARSTRSTLRKTMR